MDFFNVIIVWSRIFERYFFVFHVECSGVTTTEASIGSLLWIECNLMVNQVCGEILELNCQIILAVNSIEKVNKFTDKLWTFNEWSVLEHFAHNSHKLVHVSFLLRKHLKMLRDLQQLN